MNSSETPHLLSVEDNPNTRLLLKKLLDEEFELTFATDAQEALDTIGSDKPFDLLLVDINLGPGKSGTDLLHKIEHREDVGDLQAIALTAYAMPGDRQELLSEGFDEYVGKPFTRDQLTTTIEQVLGTM